ncbi:hypothetical protein [Streptosporangium sp. KLBMP 9127]|nr:hypothetical protein [Streptosporangium sp. KLBMP 9127]
METGGPAETKRFAWHALDRTLEVRIMHRYRKAQHTVGTWRMIATHQKFGSYSKALATHLDMIEPGWVIWYGVASSRFFAIPAWNCQGLLIVQADSAGELVEQMRAVEDGSRALIR